MLAFSDFSTWLAALGVTATIVDGAALIPPQPDRMVMVTLAGGPGLATEQRVDRQTVSIRCRGLQRQPGDAQTLAAQVDDAILDASSVATVGAAQAIGATRLGGAPRFVSVDKADRAHYQAQYLITIAR